MSSASAVASVRGQLTRVSRRHCFPAYKVGQSLSKSGLEQPRSSFIDQPYSLHRAFHSTSNMAAADPYHEKAAEAASPSEKHDVSLCHSSNQHRCSASASNHMC